MQTTSSKSNAENLNAELNKLLKRQVGLTKALSTCNKEFLENQNKINALILKRINAKIVKTKVSENILNDTQIGKLLGVSKSTLYRLRRDEGLPHHKVKKKITYKRNEVEEWQRNRNRQN